MTLRIDSASVSVPLLFDFLTAESGPCDPGERITQEKKEAKQCTHSLRRKIDMHISFHDHEARALRASRWAQKRLSGQRLGGSAIWGIMQVIAPGNC